MNRFKFIGRFVKPKQDYYKVRSLLNGEATSSDVSLCFVSGETSQFVKFKGFKWVDDGKNVIRAMSLRTKDNASTKMEIDWDERNDPEILKQVAPYSKYVYDTTDPDIADAPVNKREFLSDSEYVELVKNLVVNDMIFNRVYEVSGNIEYRYDVDHATWWREFVVTRIKLVADNTPVEATVSYDTYFYGKDFLDTNLSEKTGKMVLKMYTKYYDQKCKGNFFTPVTAVLRTDKELDMKFAEFLNAFNEDKVYSCPMTFTYFRGAPRIQVSEEQALTPQLKKKIEMGLIDKEEALKALNREAYGDRIEELYYKTMPIADIAPVATYTRADLFAQPCMKAKDNNATTAKTATPTPAPSAAGLSNDLFGNAKSSALPFEL